MQTEVRISETEYRQLLNAAKRNNAEIDRKAYKIAERLNKIDVTIEIDDYRGEDIRASLDGNIETYCLKSVDYREMPADLRALLRKLDKQLQSHIKRKTEPYYRIVSEVRRYNLRLFTAVLWLGITNIITLLILLFK